MIDITFDHEAFERSLQRIRDDERAAIHKALHVDLPPAVEQDRTVTAMRCLGCDRQTIYTGRPYCGVCQAQRIGNEPI